MFSSRSIGELFLPICVEEIAEQLRSLNRFGLMNCYSPRSFPLVLESIRFPLKLQEVLIESCKLKALQPVAQKSGTGGCAFVLVGSAAMALLALRVSLV
jgi:hypothetical protein